jgi:hypothetical protein
MKLTKILETVISEIGDTSNVETYKTVWNSDFLRPISELGDDIVYIVSFSTGAEKNDNKYRVYNSLSKETINDKESWYMTTAFGVEGKDNAYDYKSVVNNDKMYRVMATVISIIKQVLAKFEKEGEYIRQIWIDPSKNFEEDTRRARLYTAYIKKNMPKGSKLEIPEDMSYIKVILPEPE